MATKVGTLRALFRTQRVVVEGTVDVSGTNSCEWNASLAKVHFRLKLALVAALWIDLVSLYHNNKTTATYELSSD